MSFIDALFPPYNIFSCPIFSSFPSPFLSTSLVLCQTQTMSFSCEVIEAQKKRFPSFLGNHGTKIQPGRRGLNPIFLSKSPYQKGIYRSQTHGLTCLWSSSTCLTILFFLIEGPFFLTNYFFKSCPLHTFNGFIGSYLTTSLKKKKKKRIVIILAFAIYTRIFDQSKLYGIPLRLILKSSQRSKFSTIYI